jgi:CBS domain-containing protein
MSKQIISVTEDVSVEKIADLMIANKINRVPVLSGEKLVGIVSEQISYGRLPLRGDSL